MNLSLYRQISASPGEEHDGGKYKLRMQNIIHWSLHVIFVLYHLATVPFHKPPVACTATSSPGEGFQRLYSPLWDEVVYSPKMYDHVNFDGSTSPFKGRPRPELDEAWSGILNHSMITVDGSAMEALNQTTHDAKQKDGRYFALIDVFHQLHCLDLMRKSMFRKYYSNYAAFQDSEEKIFQHVDHCIDVLRQKVMCDCDIDVVVFTDHGKEDIMPSARFETVHMCRNFGAIQQWTFDHAWDR